MVPSSFESAQPISAIGSSLTFEPVVTQSPVSRLHRNGDHCGTAFRAIVGTAKSTAIANQRIAVVFVMGPFDPRDVHFLGRESAFGGAGCG
jgi:hypothetical protein